MSYIPLVNPPGGWVKGVYSNHLLDRVNEKGKKIPDPDGWHYGIATRKDGYYIILIEEHVAGGAIAEVVSPDEALDQIIKRNRLEVLERKELAQLKKLYESRTSGLA